MVTWNELVAEAVERFAALDVPEPEISARWIARQATGTEGAEWLEVADRPATKRQVTAFDRMVERRSGGEPLQYVLGSWGFRSLDLFIDRRVLIPRPETEIIAGRALAEADRLFETRPPRRPTLPAGGRPETPLPGPLGQSSDVVVVDLGTGSGAIGLSMALERPGTEVWLTDLSDEALQVARANLAGIGRAGGRVRLAGGNWFDALPRELAGRVGVVVANPPYVAAEADLEPQVAAWEPLSALLADNQGTAHLIELVDNGPGWLAADGALVLEMAPDQVQPMVERARRRFAEVEPVRDLAGRERGLVGRFPRAAD